MTKKKTLSEVFDEKMKEMDEVPRLQLLVIKTADGMTYEYFGHPIKVEEITGLTLGPLLPLEEILDYLELGVEEYLGREGDRGPWTMN